MERRSSMDAVEGSSPIRYVRTPKPIVFPVEAEVPEGRRHLKLRTFLFTTFERAFGARAAIGSEQFVYFRASDARRCLAPDLFVRLAAPNDDFDIWKTWERGAPELGVEIVSPLERRPGGRAAVCGGPPGWSSSGEPERSWESKLADYHEAGFVEVVRFDADALAGARLRVWDRVDGDLVERLVEGDRTPCATLGGHWVVAPVGPYPAGLRLEDPSGALWPSPEEAEARAEAERIEAEALRARAEARVAELEAELKRRGQK
ncbi:MAG: Uma2 family endonuclease [Polyangiaceae bacterium]